MNGQNGEDIISIRGLKFRWPGSAAGFGVDECAFRKGGRTLLIGPSGSGKSTFLNLLCGVIKADVGLIRVLGQDLYALSPGQRDRFRAAHYGVIFQMFNLLPYGSVIDNITLPLHFSKTRKARAEDLGGGETEARRLAAQLGLEPEIIDARSAAELSVGQQQRVAAARALIGQPELIVADEPTSALDQNSQQNFLELLFAEIERSGATLIMVSHNEGLGQHFDRIEPINGFFYRVRQEVA